MTFGFSGSRHSVPANFTAIFENVVRQGATHIATGCAQGVDRAARIALRSHPQICKIIFQVSDKGNRFAYAQRSVDCVNYVAEKAGYWLSFPDSACPEIITHPWRNQWRSAGGSGTWGSAALAAGRGCKLVVFLPAGVSAPAWAGGCWVAAPSWLPGGLLWSPSEMTTDLFNLSYQFSTSYQHYFKGESHVWSNYNPSPPRKS